MRNGNPCGVAVGSDGLIVGVAVLLAVGVRLGSGVFDPVLVAVDVLVAVLVILGVRVGVSVSVGSGVIVGAGVSVISGVRVTVGDGVIVQVAKTVGMAGVARLRASGGWMVPVSNKTENKQTTTVKNAKIAVIVSNTPLLERFINSPVGRVSATHAGR